MRAPFFSQNNEWRMSKRKVANVENEAIRGRKRQRKRKLARWLAGDRILMQIKSNPWVSQSPALSDRTLLLREERKLTSAVAGGESEASILGRP